MSISLKEIYFKQLIINMMRSNTIKEFQDRENKKESRSLFIKKGLNLLK